MNINCLKDDIDWFIYADYLEERGIPSIRQEQDENIPWSYEYFPTRLVNCINFDDIGTITSCVGGGNGVVGAGGFTRIGGIGNDSVGGNQ
jgi:hypothetical protein